MNKDSENNRNEAPLPLKRENKPNFSAGEQLSSFFDPYILDNLNLLTVSGLQPPRQLTIVFWDVTGFSTMCRTLNKYPDKIKIFLRLYYEAAIRIVRKHRGILDNFAGDGVLAHFGQEDEENGSPESAVAAALELKQVFKEVKNDFIRYCFESAGKEIDLGLKCGIHNGVTSFGIIETTLQNTVTLFGDEVNLASRLVEELAFGDEIIVTKEIRNMVKESDNFEYQDISDRLKLKKIKSYEEIEIAFQIIDRSS